MTASAFVFLIIATSVVKINDFNRLQRYGFHLHFESHLGHERNFYASYSLPQVQVFSEYLLYSNCHPFVMSIITIYSLYRNCLKKLIISDFYFIILIGISRNLRFYKNFALVSIIFVDR